MKKHLLNFGLLALAWLASGSVMAHDGDHSYNAKGICTIDGCTDKYQAPALVDGWYQLTNAGNVEWIGEFVAGSHGGNIYPKVKMMNDIDFTGVSHTPIGNSPEMKFNGIFDGQGHRITNMVVNLNQENVGLIGWARGPKSDGDNNTTIQNLIIDKTCSFTGKGRVAAFIGRGQVSNDDNSIVYITNCVNEANVTATSGTCAAFVGRHDADDNSPRIWISGCANHGDITAGPSDKAAAFIGWYNNNGRDGGNSTIEHSYNTGVVSPKDGGTILFRGSYRTIINTYDLKNSENTQGTPFRGTDGWSTDDPVASGELAYYINQKAGKRVFYQTLGTDADDAYPVPFSTSGRVYAHGNSRCNGEALPDSTYNNDASVAPIIHHNYSNGICQNDGCTTPYQAPELEGEWYKLTNAGNVEWFSDKVNGGELAIKGKMMNDIDFTGVTHTPIGNRAENKYNGTFDGQGHRITNMNINRDSENNIGFFGWLRVGGTTTIKNLIIDASCSIHGNNRIGGITGTYQTPIGSNGTITIENVINEANISAKGEDAGGIFGGREGGNATIIIKNVLNKGNVTSTYADAYVGALCSYLESNGDSKIENFVNLGTIGTHKGGNIGRHNIGNVTNLIDLSDTANKTQGTDSGLTTDDIANGKLAYTVGWGQLIGTDAHPSPLSDVKVNYISSVGYTTQYIPTTDVVIPSGVEAYAGVVNGDYLRLVAIENAISKDDAVILKGSEGYYSFVPTTDVSPAASNNLLGSDGSVAGGSTIYALAKFDDKVGFYQVEEDVTIPAGKAYLVDGAGVKGFTFDFDEDATGISLMEDGRSKMEDGAIYNVAGQRISKMQKGINIVNGKKVLK